MTTRISALLEQPRAIVRARRDARATAKKAAAYEALLQERIPLQLAALKNMPRSEGDVQTITIIKPFGSNG